MTTTPESDGKPEASEKRDAVAATARPVMTAQDAISFGYHWALWVFLSMLVIAQFSCIWWDSSERFEALTVGDSPSVGFHHLPDDPEPYADRCIVCVLDGGRKYKPMRLSQALLRSVYTAIENATRVDGYRIVRRQTVDSELFQESETHYHGVCSLLAWTLDGIVESCTKLGFSVADDFLRIVDGVSDVAPSKAVRDSLPILLEPLYDGSLFARYILPGLDGSACVV